MLETILRRVIIIGAFLVLLVPFVVTNSSFFPYIVGKAVAFRVIVGLMLGAWAGLVAINPVYRPRWSPVMIASGLFLLIVGIADAVGINPLRSFWSNFERMEGFVTLFYVVAYLFVVGSVVRSEKLWMWFWNASLITSVIATLTAFTQIHRDFPGQLIRVSGPLGNPAYFAVYLLVNVFIACFLTYRTLNSEKINKVLVGAYTGVIIIEILGLYYAATRGALLGLIAGAGLTTLILLVRGRDYPRTRRVAGAIVGLAVIVFVAFIALRHTAFIQDNPTFARVANISLADSTVQSRITLWTSVGRLAILERPLLGWGQDNFIVAFGKYYDPSLYNQEPWFDRAHNVFVDWFIATGAVGLLAYIAIFIASLWMLWKSTLSLPEKAILTGLLGAYVCNNVFVFDNLTSYIYFALFLAYVHAHASYPRGEVAPPSQSSEMDGFIVVGFGVLAIALIWFTAARPMLRAQTLLDALRIDYSQHDPMGALALYEKALAYGDITGLEETREQLSQTAIRALNNPDANQETRNIVVNRSIAELVDSASDEPDNSRRLFFLAHMLKISERFKDAHTVFDQALALNPTRQNFLYEVAQIYLAEGNFEKAADTFKTAYDVETKNDTAFQYYAGALMFDGKTAEADALLVERFGTTTVDNELIFQAYEKIGRNDKLAEILELRLRNMAPADDPGVRVSLALVYLDLGRRDEAITQIQKAAEIKPDFAAQAEQMVAAIKAGKKIIVNQ